MTVHFEAANKIVQIQMSANVTFDIRTNFYDECNIRYFVEKIENQILHPNSYMPNIKFGFYIRIRMYEILNSDSAFDIRI